MVERSIRALRSVGRAPLIGWRKFTPVSLEIVWEGFGWRHSTILVLHLHCATLQYINYSTLHYTTFHYTTLL